MKMQKVFAILVILTLLAAFVPAVNVSAAAEKVAVCHIEGTGDYHLITISEAAFLTHVAHGDASPSDWVPGQPGKKFNDDCSLITIPQKELVETITVPSNGSTVTSIAVLTNGAAYELEASGTYRFVNWANAGIADARFSLRIPTSYNNTGAIAWIDGKDLIPGYPNYLQVWVNNAPFTWGTGFSADHVYTSAFTGAGSTISFKIVDNAYGDNSGTITVNIYRINW